MTVIEWLQRLVRAWDQSRIRLPRQLLSPHEIQPGDWVQIETRLWRVKARRGRSTYELETVEEATPSAFLHMTEDSFWTLQHSDDHLRLSPETVIVYPVTQRSSSTMSR